MLSQANCQILQQNLVRQLCPGSQHQGSTNGTWSAEVEDAFRLQMAGYRDLQAATPTHPNIHPCHSPPSPPPTSAPLCESEPRAEAGRAHAAEPSPAASQPPVATCLARLWQELLLLGELPPERWDGDGFIKKLTSRETIGETVGAPRIPTMPPMA